MFRQVFVHLWLYFISCILELISEETLNESLSAVIR